MKKTKSVPEEVIECDGCEYIIDKNTPHATFRVPSINGAFYYEFHFHSQATRHDCFRYWAHNPRIMERSLKNQGLSEYFINTFMKIYLYRESSHKPGVERESNE